jgi:hypothetical protein
MMGKRRTRKEKLRAKKRRRQGSRVVKQVFGDSEKETDTSEEVAKVEGKVKEVREAKEGVDKLYVYPVKMIKRDLVVSLVIAGGVLIGEGLLYWGWEQSGLMGWLK